MKVRLDEVGKAYLSPGVRTGRRPRELAKGVDKSNQGRADRSPGVGGNHQINGALALAPAGVNQNDGGACGAHTAFRSYSAQSGEIASSCWLGSVDAGIATESPAQVMGRRSEQASMTGVSLD